MGWDLLIKWEPLLSLLLFFPKAVRRPAEDPFPTPSLPKLPLDCSNLFRWAGPYSTTSAITLLGVISASGAIPYGPTRKGLMGQLWCGTEGHG